MKTVLLTGFEPFNGAPINPAWEAVQALDGWGGEGWQVVVRQLPCVFGQANASMNALLAELGPDLVIAVGQAGGRNDLTFERVAINVDDAAILDNGGQQPVDVAVVEHGPAAYFTTLPIKAMVAAVRGAGIPASVSQTAGTFVCNHVFYGVMHATAGTAVKAGFIHVPFLPSQAAARPERPASMALADIVAGLKLALQVALEVEVDTREAGGATH